MTQLTTVWYVGWNSWLWTLLELVLHLFPTQNSNSCAVYRVKRILFLHIFDIFIFGKQNYLSLGARFIVQVLFLFIGLGHLTMFSKNTFLIVIFSSTSLYKCVLQSHVTEVPWNCWHFTFSCQKIIIDWLIAAANNPAVGSFTPTYCLASLKGCAHD